LKFNRLFEKCERAGERGMRYQTPLLRGFLNKLVHDVLPAALASLIGGFLFTHFQLARVPEPAAAQAAPASAEMMQLLRDEHGLIADFLNAQLANEKKQALVRGREAPAGAEPAVATADPRQVVVAMAAAKPVAPRGKNPVIGALLPPLVIAQVRPNDGNGTRPLARHEDSLIAETISIKDRVVAVTQRVVTTMSGIPSWIGSIGDRIGGEDANPRPSVDLVSAS
jgi:hypothetical protein